MGQDTIQAIRDAEQKADQLEQDSASECAAILANARGLAKKETESMVAKARELSREVLEQAHQKADETMAAAVDQAQADIQAMGKNAAAKKEEAIRMILSELI